MANAPVIFDDGGSTRIKQLKDYYYMDGLLGTTGQDGTIFQAKAYGQFLTDGEFTCHLKVRYHELNGDEQILPFDFAKDGTSGVDLQQADTVVIASQNGQIATLTFNGDAKLNIVLTSAVAQVNPIVEAKQMQKQRRYVVTNAGAIKTVTLTRDGQD